MRDSVFVGMPKVAELGNLTRASLPIANKDTFLYAASVLDLRKEMEPGWQTPAVGWIGGLQKITGALSANGISLEEWKSAFGSEVGLVGSWGTSSQFPSLVAAMPVKDSAKANKIMTTITSANTDDVRWTHQEKEGVHYYSSSPAGQLFSFSPTIGLSDRMLIVGADTGSVDAAMKRSRDGRFRAGGLEEFPERGARRADSATGIRLPRPGTYLCAVRYDVATTPGNGSGVPASRFRHGRLEQTAAGRGNHETSRPERDVAKLSRRRLPRRIGRVGAVLSNRHRSGDHGRRRRSNLSSTDAGARADDSPRHHVAALDFAFADT